MPDWRAVVRDRFAAHRLDPVAHGALIDELAQHLEDRFAESRSAGASEQDALAAALAELDGHERLAEELLRRRAVGAAPPPIADRAACSAGLWSDLVRAAHALFRTPAFTVAAVVTVALTTGPATAALGMANWLFLGPLPGVRAPDRLVSVNFGTPNERGGYSVSRASYAHVETLVAAAPSLDGIAGWQAGSVSVSTGDTPRVVRAEFVSVRFFSVLGVRFVAGRPFLVEEDRDPGGTPVVVLASPLAASLFPDSEPIGLGLRVNGQHFTVVGVAAPEFYGSNRLGRTQVWLPGLSHPRVHHVARELWRYEPDRGPFYMHVARLASGATMERASAELVAAAEALAANDPTAGKFETVRPLVEPGFAAVPARLLSPVAPLLGVGIVLVLLGTANLANLFGFRSARHAHESAIRRALGASGYQLVRPLMFEALLVAVAGGLAGLGLAVLLRTTMGAMLVGVDSVDVPVTWRLAAGAFGLSVGVGLLLAVLPARLAARAGLSTIIGQGSRATTRPGTGVRRWLAATQLALSMTLLIGALLFVATLRNLRGVDAGFDPTGVVTFDFEFRLQGYDAARVQTFLEALMETVAEQAGVSAVAVGVGTPQYGGETNYRVFLPDSLPDDPPRVPVSAVTGGYFDVLGMRFVAGSGFGTPAATEAAAGIVISESLARRAFGGAREATGGLIRFPETRAEPEHPQRVLGVVDDVRAESLREEGDAMIYRPLVSWQTVNALFLIRSSRPSDDAIRLVREAAASIDPALAFTPTPMTSRVDARLGRERLLAWTLGVLAVLGFLIAAVGLHGLVSQSVVERVREFGIRLAVGASRGQVIWLVVRSSLIVVLAGVPLGMLLAGLGGALVRSQLYGIEPASPVAHAAAALALVAVVIVASLVPAWRASRANPVDVLRTD